MFFDEKKEIFVLVFGEGTSGLVSILLLLTEGNNDEGEFEELMEAYIDVFIRAPF